MSAKKMFLGLVLINFLFSSFNSAQACPSNTSPDSACQCCDTISSAWMDIGDSVIDGSNYFVCSAVSSGCNLVATSAPPAPTMP